MRNEIPQKYIEDMKFMVDYIKIPFEDLFDSIEDVVNYGDAEMVYEYALIVNDYPKKIEVSQAIVDNAIKLLGEGIVTIYNKYSSEFIYKFAKKFPNLDRDMFAKALVKQNKEEWLSEFAELLNTTVEELKEQYAEKEEESEEVKAEESINEEVTNEIQSA